MSSLSKSEFKTHAIEILLELGVVLLYVAPIFGVIGIAFGYFFHADVILESSAAITVATIVGCIRHTCRPYRVEVEEEAETTPAMLTLEAHELKMAQERMKQLQQIDEAEKILDDAIRKLKEC